jgi:dTDP-4-dehydrorhamnose 3,5-epimerase
VYLAEGLGHAFMTLSEQATVLYLCSTPHNRGREHGVHPLDPSLGIAWPADAGILLSERDSGAPSLAEARERGLLPAWRACPDHSSQPEDLPFTC